MKKIITFLIIFSCVPVLFGGCSQKQAASMATTGDTNVCAYYEWPRLLTEEDIAAFAAGKLTFDGVGAIEGFVDYDAIRIIGDLTADLGEERKGGLNVQPYRRDWYNYYLTDANGYIFKLGVVHPGQAKDTEEAGKEKNKKDISAIECGESGFVEQYGIVKKYAHFQKLTEIWIYVDDVKIVVSSVDGDQVGLKDYPTEGEKTILCRLINGTESEIRSAVREFEDWFFAHSPSRNIRRLLPPIGIGTAVVALGVTGFVVWKKKKRKAANKPESPEPQPVDTPQQT